MAMIDHAKNAEAIFLAALEKITPGERAAFVGGACADNPELLQRVKELLASHEESQGPFDAPPPGLGITVGLPPIAETAGSKIGPYKLLEQIGEGGFGVVFMAEQLEPVRRRVALKVVKPGMDSKQIIARFEAERQALALMDHPNIAKVLEAGATESGRPFFVMELVRGLPITDYCDQNQLTARQRLELFVPVCQAVQHAHQKGIIHRDIKPTNVLVTLHDGTPIVKVIDFGIAKATGQQLTEKTLFTNFAQMIGTPLYMSPEQAALSALDVDTRSDIYSLGVLLYELLTGTTPFDKARFREAAFDEIRRIIREEDPPKPSTRISTLGQASATVSAQRQSDPKRLSQLFRGDLDWIVMKALEKDRNGRYETASAFAADVQRHLADESVEARPPSALYKVRKFVRRNKRTLLIGALLGTALIIAIMAVAASIGWVARDRATRQILVELGVADDLKEADTWQRQEQWDKALDALKRATARLEGSAQGPLQDQVATRRRDAAFVLRLEQARLEALAFAQGKDRLDPAVQRTNYLALVENSRKDRDYPAVDQAYRLAFEENGLDLAVLTAENAARLVLSSAIRAHLVRALDDWAHCKDHLPKGDGGPLRAVARLADDDQWRARLREAKLSKDRVALEGLAAEEAVLAQPPENLLRLFTLLEGAKAQAAGLLLLQKAQQLHPADFWINYQLGLALGKYPARATEAVAFCRVALAIQPRSAVVYLNLANALGIQGVEKEPEAEAACRKAIELQPSGLAYFCLGNSLRNQNRAPEAIAAFHKSIALKPDSVWTYRNLANVLIGQRYPPPEQVEAAFRKVIELKSDDANAFNNLGVALGHQGKQPEAEAAYRKAIELDPNNGHPYQNLSSILRGQGKLSEAEAACRKAIELNPNHAEAYVSLGSALRAQGRLPEAVAAHRKAIELNPNHAEAYFNLGNVLFFGQRKLLEAEAAYRKATEVNPNLAAPLDNLGHVLIYQQKYPEAVAAARKAVDLNPLDINIQYTAACIAALAGSALGKDTATVDTAELARYRGQALAWLRAALTATRKELENEPGKDRPALGQRMQDWQRDSGFNGVRGDDALAKLPEAERQEWRKLWEEVGELRKRAGAEKQALFEAKLNKFLRGEMKSADPAELVALAEFCRNEELYAAAVRLYREAFATGLVNAHSEIGYHFACAAALAGCGEGTDGAALEAGERARLRGEALSWLRGELPGYWRSLASNPEKIRGWVRGWQQDSAFAGVRGDEALAKLPEAERQEWQALWQEVEESGKLSVHRNAAAAYRKAIECGSKNASLFEDLGANLYEQRKLRQAEQASRKAIDLNPTLAGSYHNLGCVLYLQDKLPQAEEASRAAIKLKHNFANAYNTLENILRAQQKLSEADSAQRKAIELDNVAAEANLGYLLMGQGRFSEALAAFKRAHELKSQNQHPYGTYSFIRWAEQWIMLDAKLAKVLKGESQPADPAEGAALAELCQLRSRQLYAASTRLCSEAFTADPTLVNEPRTGVRFDAACAAAQAGCGQGKDAGNLDAKEYARLRGQALTWLRADLASWRLELEGGPSTAHNGVRYEMDQWRQDPMLACVRGEEALATLPEPERQEWQKLWEEVEELATRAAESK
jgi:serine/threonine protein kinase/Flp pilus assembly protein TadD